MTATTQITSIKLKEINVIKLYEHYHALEKALPLLMPESQEIAKAELEACLNLRSEKIDRIYYAMCSHEDSIERIKKEKVLIAAAQKYHESQVESIKGLLNYLRRVLPFDTNKITGLNYQFTLVKKKDLTVEIKTELKDWSQEEREQYCIAEEVTTTKQIVLRSLSGDILEERMEPSHKINVIPNLDAIRNAYQTSEQLPRGVKVFQEYSIRSKRIYSNVPMGCETPQYPGQFLPEGGGTDES
jgi:hypothetical protein